MSETDPVVLTNVTRHFGRFAAVRSVTASFRSGRLYAVLGENGAGKSTLLRIMAGLLPPTRGTVTVLGTTEIRAVRDRIGYMGHAPLLYDELGALENLRYFAGLYGIFDDRLCATAIARVGLDPALRRHVGQYSQGMRQRISLARAIVHGPSLLLLDEPFSNVDAASAQAMVRLLGTMRDGAQGIAANSGAPTAECKTIFVTTHQPALLENVADEFIWMEAGRIVARAAHLHQGPQSAAASSSVPAVPR